MRSAHTAQQVRDAEAPLLAAGPQDALMRQAAAGLAGALLDLLGTAYGRRVRLLVGAGGNGGDALWAGATLARRGAVVEAVLLAEEVHPRGLAALRAAGGRVLDAAEAVAAPPVLPDVVVDGVLGTGGRPGLPPAARAALDAVAGAVVVAVDVPSGVDVDGATLPADHVVADLTVAFGTLKPCLLADPAAAAAGTVHLVDLGLGPLLPEAPLEALQADDVARLLPRPAPDAHKYTRGVVGVRAGSARYPGAGLLCVAGAAVGLAGMVRYVGDDAVAARVVEAHPEVVVGDGRVQAWAVGSGGDAAGDPTSSGALDEVLRQAREDGVAAVLDADALTDLPAPLPGPVVLTPHAGELARMLGVDRDAVEAAPLAHVRRAADRWGCTVLLKGRRTLVAHPGGRVRVSTTGTPWLATAGAGDVLAGLVGALLAAGLDPFDAAAVGSWLHGAAATLASGAGADGGGPIAAGDVARAVPAVVRSLGRALPAP